MSLFAELKKRNVLRAAAAYVAVSWLLIQVVETLFPVFGLSDGAIRLVVIVLAIGFVPAIIVAWAFELTPSGFVRDEDVDRTSAAVQANTKRLDRVIMVVLAAAVGFFAVDKFVFDPARDAAIADAAREEGRIAGAQQRRESGRPVVAVLPFTSVTPNEDSEFFAAGVHDDLLTKLAQLPAMLVISRSSVLEYKDVQRNIREIGEALGADAILEGGVQAAGGRIRINAQLIDAKTDEHLWAETYDEELTAKSIFDVQGDIARAIAEALNAELAETNAASKIPTQNMAAYRAWHEAIELRESMHGGEAQPEYRELLQKANDLDPTFVRPLAELVGSLALSVWFQKDEAVIARTEAVLEKIQAVAPGSVDHLMAQTYYTYYVLNDYDLAHDVANQALTLAPSDTRLLMIRGWIERRQGDFEGRIETMRTARQLDPRDPIYTGLIANTLYMLHRYDEALAELETHGDHQLGLRYYKVISDSREHGDLHRLADDLEALLENNSAPRQYMEVVFHRMLARDEEGSAAAIAGIPDEGLISPEYHGLITPGAMAQLAHLTMFGPEDELLDYAAAVKAAILGAATEEQLEGASPLLPLAWIAAVEGDRDEAVSLIDKWWQGIGTDWATRSGMRDIACQILGRAGAAQEAVECIREGLEEPSTIVPWLEPRNPMYDPIRETPEFRALAEELANWSKAP